MNEDFEILNSVKGVLHFEKPYTVPKGYFEQLSNSVLLKISTQKTSYSVPENYFADLSDSILSKIKKNDISTELEQIAPGLNKINKVNVYATPANYFNNINSKKPTSKVISFNSRLVKYVAAACIIAIVSVSSFFYFNKKNNEIGVEYSQAIHTNVESAILNLNDDELNNSVDALKSSFSIDDIKNNNLPFSGLIQEEVKQLDDASIENYFTSNNIDIIENNS